MKSFIGLKTPTGNTITSDVDLSMYLLKSGQVAALSGSKFYKEGYIRLAYAALDVETIKIGLLKLNEALFLE